MRQWIFSALIMVAYVFKIDAQKPPSAWQKFKGVFSKKPKITAPASKSIDNSSVLSTLTKMHNEIKDFISFSKQVTTAKIKAFTLVQKSFEEAKKMQQQAKVDQLRQQIMRLRADFFNGLVDVLGHAKKGFLSIKNIVQLGDQKNSSTVDDIIKKLDSLLKQGSGIDALLLRAGNKGDAKNFSELSSIQSYYGNIMSLLSYSSIDPMIIAAETSVQKVSTIKSVLKELVSASSLSIYLFIEALRNVIRFYYPAELEKDISEDIDKHMRRLTTVMHSAKNPTRRLSEMEKYIENIISKVKKATQDIEKQRSQEPEKLSLQEVQQIHKDSESITAQFYDSSNLFFND